MKKPATQYSQTVHLIGLLLWMLSCFWVSAQENPPADSLKTSVDTVAVFGDNIHFSSNAPTAKILYSARDSILYDITNQMLYLYGNGSIEQNDIKLTGGIIEYKQDDNTLRAMAVEDSLGNLSEIPIFTEGEHEFRANELAYNFKTKKGRIKEVVTREGEGFLFSKQVKKNQYDEMFAADAYYTTCNLEHPHFKITSNKVKVVPQKVLVTGPANLVVEDIPTPLLLPFGIFPIAPGRNSGILIPSYGESSQFGFFLKNGGLYFGLGKHADMALRSEIYSRGTWRLSASSGYKLRYRYQGNVSIDFGKIKNGDPITDDYSENREFFIRWQHRQDPKANPFANFSASVNLGSSTYNRNFLNTTQNYLNNTFASSISYSYQFPNAPFNFTISGNHSQNTQSRIVNIDLPNIALNMVRQTPLKRKNKIGSNRWYESITVGYALNTKSSVSVADSLLFTPETRDKIRSGVQHSIPVSTNFQLFKYIAISPTFSFDEKWYWQTIDKYWDATVRYDTTFTEIDGEQTIATIDTINGMVVIDTLQKFRAAHYYNMGVSASTKLFGMFNFKKGRIKAIRHTLTPAIGFNFHPNFGSETLDYYRDVQNNEEGDISRYSIFEGSLYGGPPDGKSGAISFNLDNNIEMKTRTKSDTGWVEKKLKIIEGLSLNGISYDLARDSLNWSNFSIRGRTTLFEKININFGANFDPYQIDYEGNKINKLLWNENGKIARMTSTNIGLSSNFSSGKKQSASTNRGTEAERNDVAQNPDAYIDYKIPWNLSLSYNLSIQKQYHSPDSTSTNYIQTLGGNINFNLSPRWKIAIRTGYDFTNKALAFTTVDVYRDLHCWDMSFNWIPIGARRQYEFTLKVRSTMLQDLKLQRRRNWFDYY
ncbi:MAG: putative LPS assembly protein LptD [Chitinophagales bacterium]